MRDSLSTTLLCSLGISPPGAETNLTGKCISLQSWAIPGLPAGWVAWEGFGFSPSLSSPPSLPCPHITFFMTSLQTHTPSCSLSLSLFLSHCPCPPLSCAYLPSFAISLFFLSFANSISLPLCLCVFVYACLCFPFHISLLLSSFTTPKLSPSILQPLQRQEITVVQGARKIQF